MLQDLPTPLPAQGRTFASIRKLVAKALLEYVGASTTERPRFTQRDIATTVGTDWGMVHISLRSLQDEGAIRIERHRIIINKGALLKIARG